MYLFMWMYVCVCVKLSSNYIKLFRSFRRLSWNKFELVVVVVVFRLHFMLYMLLVARLYFYFFFFFTSNSIGIYTAYEIARARKHANVHHKIQWFTENFPACNRIGLVVSINSVKCFRSFQIDNNLCVLVSIRDASSQQHNQCHFE